MFLYITWDISPEIVSIGPLHLRWYGLLFAFAFYFTYRVLIKMFREEGKNPELVDQFFLYGMLGIVVGARLGHVLFYDIDYLFYIFFLFCAARFLRRPADKKSIYPLDTFDLNTF